MPPVLVELRIIFSTLVFSLFMEPEVTVENRRHDFLLEDGPIHNRMIG
jgi:hypothetical protein